MSEAVLKVANLTEFFREALHGAARHQRLALEDHTEHYVVNLLASFARADALFERSGGRLRVQPLALQLAAAAEAPTAGERNRGLQRLGDVSLFVAGFLARGFPHRLVDVDYHIAMGGAAYGYLAEADLGSRSRRVFAGVFRELASKFRDLVDALNEIADGARGPGEEDALRLYEVWLKTGSRRADAGLRTRGICPVPAARTRFQH
jgi:hypothetical protein